MNHKLAVWNDTLYMYQEIFASKLCVETMNFRLCFLCVSEGVCLCVCCAYANMYLIFHRIFENSFFLQHSKVIHNPLNTEVYWLAQLDVVAEPPTKKPGCGNNSGLRTHTHTSSSSVKGDPKRMYATLQQVLYKLRQRLFRRSLLDRWNSSLALLRTFRHPTNSTRKCS